MSELVNVDFTIVTQNGWWVWVIHEDSEMVACAGMPYETELLAAEALLRLLQGRYADMGAVANLMMSIDEMRKADG